MALLSIIFAGVTALGVLGNEPSLSHHESSPVKFTQLQIEPENVGIDPRIKSARGALRQAYPGVDLSVLVYLKYGLNQPDLFEVAANEFVTDLGARTAFETPDLMLRVQSLVRKKDDIGETETFGLTLHEGAKTIAASRTTVTCQGANVKDATAKTPSGCLVDSATVSEMFGRLAGKI